MKKLSLIVMVWLNLVSVATVPILAAGHLGLLSQEEFHWQGEVGAGKTLEIKGINGNIHAEPSSDGRAEVLAAKHGHHHDPKSVEIRVVEHRNGVTICAVYPSVAGRPNECVPGDGEGMNVRNNDVSVDFAVHVPTGVRLVGRTVNGQVQTSALGGEIEAHTVNGNVQISTSSYAQGGTVNGSITASLGSSNWPHSVEFETVNGSITLELPAATTTQFEADTVNGNISTDFPLTVQGKLSPKHISGTIGGGGERRLVLKTVNGNIEVRRTH
jgi:hypothetical protein